MQLFNRTINIIVLRLEAII